MPYQYQAPKVQIPSAQVPNYREAVEKLIEKGAIERCRSSRDQFVSSYFLVPKPDGSFRFILNLKKLNQFIKAPHFKLEDIRTAARLIFPGVHMCTIDLRDAYYLISIQKESRRFLRFEFEGQLFQFTCLPFGLSMAPFIFTKIMKPVVRHLRLRGYSSVIYLDDFLCVEENAEKCIKNVRETVEMLEFLGFLINEEKSNTRPSTRCRFLGFVIDSERFSIELTEEKRERLSKAVREFEALEQCSIREFSELIGKLVAACLAMEYGWLYTKKMEREKSLALLANNLNYSSKMKIPRSIGPDLCWWKENLKKGFSTIKSGDFQLTIFTDASDTGWGAVNGNKKIYGFWSASQIGWHINYKELFTVWLALQELANNSSDCQILLRIDNTTAIAYINKMGGTRYPKYNALARKIWQWAEKRNIFLLASFIPSEKNVEADQLSRQKNVDTEWALNPEVFAVIVAKFGCPEIDLFASGLNNKCKQYCSWFPEPGATMIDAFTINWSNLYFYAFPPFSVILRVLAKIKRDRAEGILVVPNWPNQVWYPLFKSLSVGEQISFNPTADLLYLPCRSIVHPRAKDLALIATRVSGKHSNEKRSQQRR